MTNRQPIKVMKESDKFVVANKLTVRAGTGFDFIQNYLLDNPTDPAYIRSVYILEAFNFELLIKSRFITLYKGNNLQDIEEKLRSLSHKLDELAGCIGMVELKKIGIN